MSSVGVLRWRTLLVACLFLTACDSGVQVTVRPRQEPKKVAAQAAPGVSQQSEVKGAAKDIVKPIETEEDARLLSNPTTAAAFLEGRLDEWLRRDGDLLIIVDGDSATLIQPRVYVVPTSVPWMIDCDAEGLLVTIGPWSYTRDGVQNNQLQRMITSANLTTEQCDSFVRLLAKKLQPTLNVQR